MEIMKEEIENEKARMRKLGIAGFFISDGSGKMTEDESIASKVRASWSPKYVAVADPYFEMSRARQRKNVRPARRFRIFQVDPQRPSIPMGYAGMPLVNFESFERNPQDVAIETIRKQFKNQANYVAEKSRDREYVTFRKREVL